MLFGLNVSTEVRAGTDPAAGPILDLGAGNEGYFIFFLGPGDQ
jgi:hypothetical protein